MTATIQKWGNSLALRLPKTLADETHLAEGTRVELVRTEEGVLLKAKRKPHYRLSELLASVNKRNIQSQKRIGAGPWAGRFWNEGSRTRRLWCGLISIRNPAGNRPAGAPRSS